MVLPTPDYDSGWVTIPPLPNQPMPAEAWYSLTHNLGTTDLLVYICGQSLVPIISRDLISSQNNCFWLLTPSVITIEKQSIPNPIRVRLWKIQPTITPPIIKTTPP